MKVKVVEVDAALHPSEVVVAIRALDRTENLVIDRRTLQNGQIDVGFPIREDGGRYLVELPRETLSGSWRLWVNEDQVDFEDERMRA
jgi:hypothetical protein